MWDLPLPGTLCPRSPDEKTFTREQQSLLTAERRRKSTLHASEPGACQMQHANMHKVIGLIAHPMEMSARSEYLRTDRKRSHVYDTLYPHMVVLAC